MTYFEFMIAEVHKFQKKNQFLVSAKINFHFFFSAYPQNANQFHKLCAYFLNSISISKVTKLFEL